MPTPLTLPALPAAPASPASSGAPDDALRDAARDLHRQFLQQMLAASGLGDALRGGVGGEAAALTDLSFERIAEEMTEAQPQLTERLYAALRRTGA